MIGHASEPLFSSLERVEKGRACCCRRRGASVAPYAPRYSCCCCCSIPTMNTQRLSYIAQLHKTFVLQSSGWITDQTCIASIMGSTTFWSHNWIFVRTDCSWVCHIKMILLKSFISTTTTGIERSCLRYLPLLWPVWQSGAAVEHNDVILTLGLLSKQYVAHTPTSHVSLFTGWNVQVSLLCSLTLN